MIHYLFTAVPLTVLAIPIWVLNKLGEMGFEFAEEILEWLEKVTGWRYYNG